MARSRTSSCCASVKSAPKLFGLAELRFRRARPIDLEQRAGDVGDFQVVFLENAACLGDLFLVEADDVLLPHSAQLDPSHSEFVRCHFACVPEVLRDFVIDDGDSERRTGIRRQRKSGDRVRGRHRSHSCKEFATRKAQRHDSLLEVSVTRNENGIGANKSTTIETRAGSRAEFWLAVAVCETKCREVRHARFLGPLERTRAFGMTPTKRRFSIHGGGFRGDTVLGLDFARKTKRPRLDLSRGTSVDQPSPKCCSRTTLALPRQPVNGSPVPWMARTCWACKCLITNDLYYL